MILLPLAVKVTYMVCKPYRRDPFQYTTLCVRANA